jgi:ATP-dependent RNA helicase DeaD
MSRIWGCECFLSDFSTLQNMVKDIEISSDAADFIDSMEDMDYHEFVERVVTLLIEKKSNGENQIGFDQNTVNSMIDDYHDDQKVARKNNRKKKR